MKTLAQNILLLVGLLSFNITTAQEVLLILMTLLPNMRALKKMKVVKLSRSTLRKSTKNSLLWSKRIPM